MADDRLGAVGGHGRTVFDASRAERVIRFIEQLKHTKGKWHGKPFTLLPWQREVVSEIFGTIDTVTGFRAYDTAYVEIPKKNGKQVNINTVIPTPAGYTTIGEIKVGDTVFAETGKPCRVIAKSAIDYSEQAYRITFKDGEVIEAGANHQWYGEYTRGKRKSCIMTTQEIYNIPREKGTGCIRFRIPIADSLKLPEQDPPAEPYLMGYWIGNGNAVKPEITVKTSDVDEVLAQIEPYYRISGMWQNTGDSKVIRIPDLKAVLVKSHHDKTIPINYLRSSETQRLRLLQGLMDSDGCISGNKGQAIYTSTEKALAEDVSELLWSLGIKNSITTAVSTQRTDWSKPSKECGRAETGETLYYVKFTAFDDTEVCRLKRKQERAVKRGEGTRSHYRYIDKIEPIENAGMQCIQVDSPSHQYLVGRSFLPTHNSELGAAIALYLLCADGEYEAEVYSCATDIEQASIIFDTAAAMVEQNPVLKKHIKLIMSRRRLVYTPARSVYRVVSSDVKNKHGFNVSGVIFDELHAQPNRDLWDVMTKGAGDARDQPLAFAMTTAGDDENSICYEQHMKAMDIIEGRKESRNFYAKVYGLKAEDDWEDERNWYKANPSLDITVSVEKARKAYEDAKGNPVEEAKFKQLRLNIWGEKANAWMNMLDWDANDETIDPNELIGRECCGGLDLSSTLDMTAFVLCFPPRNDGEKYIFLPYFFIPADNIHERVLRDHVPYDKWAAEGYITMTPGNVVDYRYIEEKIKELASKYVVREIAYDRWNASQTILNLMDEGLTMVPFGQGYRDMSPPTKGIFTEVVAHRVIHNNNPVLRWCFGNAKAETDSAGNEKLSKKYSHEKIDGAIAAVMAYDRASRREEFGSVYDTRGIIAF